MTYDVLMAAPGMTVEAGAPILRLENRETAMRVAKAQAAFSEKEFTHLTVAIGHINLWNRVNDGLGVIAPEAQP